MNYGKRTSLAELVGALITALIIMVPTGVLLYGWGWNIVKLFREPHDGFMFVCRLVGIPIAVIGAVLGYM